MPVIKPSIISKGKMLLAHYVIMVLQDTLEKYLKDWNIHCVAANMLLYQSLE